MMLFDIFQCKIDQNPRGGLFRLYFEQPPREGLVLYFLSGSLPLLIAKLWVIFDAVYPWWKIYNTLVVHEYE